MILEGCYPYVHGGVSSWMHQYIQAMPDIEFVLWCICAREEQKGRFVYELPSNVLEVHEVALDEALKAKMDKRGVRKVTLSENQMEQMHKLFAGQPLDWDPLFELFQVEKLNPVSLLMSSSFLDILMDTCKEKFPYISFVDFFHTMRSMLLPELYLLTKEVPKADIYHATATGYSGILGSLAKWKFEKPFILTEHGIYTREREEELLRATWVVPYFRQQWIDLFYTFSYCAYSHADKVTALFNHANVTQEEIGCDRTKLMVIRNGVHYEKFSKIPLKEPDGFVDIGAVVRIAKIKDIKTMIYSFAELKPDFPKARLHILGGVDDEEYFEECKQLVEQLNLEDLFFTGVVNVLDYMQKLDFTLLASISEGQPLSVLESMAAGRPCVTTDVGCCKELLYGVGDDSFGSAGICVPPMHKDMLANALLTMCRDGQMRRQMGENGKKRVEKYYTHELSMDCYRKLYADVGKGMVYLWQE